MAESIHTGIQNTLVYRTLVYITYSSTEHRDSRPITLAESIHTGLQNTLVYRTQRQQPCHFSPKYRCWSTEYTGLQKTLVYRTWSTEHRESRPNTLAERIHAGLQNTGLQNMVYRTWSTEQSEHRDSRPNTLAERIHAGLQNTGLQNMVYRTV